MQNEEIEIKCVLELLAKPKEAAVDALKRILSTIKENGKKLSVYDEVFSEPKEVEHDFYSAFVTFKLRADIASLFSFVLDYAPTSIEVLRPQSAKLELPDLQATLNDLAGRLNEMDYLIKMYSAQNTLLAGANAKLKKATSTDSNDQTKA